MLQLRMENLPSIERLNELLEYNAETGEFRWKIPRKKMQSGERAGYLRGRHQYLMIGIDYEKYQGHRIAWAMHYGKWPDQIIDHVNGDGSDNRICNLRLATKVQNAHNTGKTVRNTSGVKGVTWHKRAERWMAQCKTDGKLRYLGLFDTKEEAGAAYQEFIRNKVGEFVREE